MSTNILIADAGSTKTDWCLINSEGDILWNTTAPGVNVAIASEAEINSNFTSVQLQLHEITPPDVIYYYGAGCASPSICESTAGLLTRVWNCPAEVASDMLGASRALLQKLSGVACILGTGSNSALYDGVSIIANTPPLGYILGDEGSGAALGKRIIGDIFKDVAPRKVRDSFLNETGLTKDSVIKKVYREPNANRFLASFAPYISRHLDEPYFHDMALDEFTRFLYRNVMNYPGISEIPVAFIGSVAVNFANVLEEALANMKLHAGRIESSPMPGLIKFHTQNNAPI